MASYRGKACKTDCSGHMAGARYARRGGRTLTISSPSFNEGMRSVQASWTKKGKKTRMGVKKNSK